MSRILRRALASAALLGLLVGAIPVAAAASEGADYGACVAHHVTTERGFSGDHNPGRIHRGFADWPGCPDD